MNTQQSTPIGITRSPEGYKAALWLSGLIGLAGMLTYFYLLAQEPGPETWGLFTVNYIFLLGITQFGVVFSAMMRICNAKWPKPFFRLAELTTVAFFPFAIVGFLFIYFYGKDDLLYWLSEHSADAHLSSWLDAEWLLYRNLGAQLVFYALSFVYFITALLPDIREDAARTGPAWRQALYRRLLALKRERDDTAIRDRLYVLSVLILIAFVPPNTFVAWDFGMMLYPHYHSSVFPMYSIMGNLFAGAASLVLLHIILSRFVETEEFFSIRQFHNMGVLLTGFALLWLYLWWAQFFVTWFGNLPHEMAPLWKQMYGHYAPFFWAMMICVVGIPIAALIFQKIKRTLWAMELLTLVMVIGIWLNRYLTVMPAIRDDHTVFTSFAEVVITAGWFSSFLFALLLMLNVLPLFARWEIALDAEEELHYKTYTMK